MSQHYLLSSAVKNLSLMDLSCISEEEAFQCFCKARWGSLDKQCCDSCGVLDKHYFRKSRKQWRCKHCDSYFSVTTKTIWADRKLPFKKMMYMLFLFTSNANGISASTLQRLVNVNYKTAWVFCHKLRETITRSVPIEPFTGEVHVDGGHFGGKPRGGQFRHKAKPEDIAEKIKLGKNQGAKRARSSAANRRRRQANRRIVMVVRQVKPGFGGERTRCFLSKAEDEGIAKYIATHCISPGSLVRTDENPAYTSYSAKFIHQTVEHSREYSTLEGVNNNQAESFFSRLRRSEYGTFHRMMARYMIDYASEMAWRDDLRRVSEKERFTKLLIATLNSGYSRWWRGYWSGTKRNDELLAV